MQIVALQNNAGTKRYSVASSSQPACYFIFSSQDRRHLTHFPADWLPESAMPPSRGRIIIHYRGKESMMTARSMMVSCSALMLGCLALAPAASAAATCESLGRLELPGVSSLSAKSFPGGTFQ